MLAGHDSRFRGLLVVLLLLGAAACASQRAARFSVENARAHVDMIAGTIGSRPAGSSNNAKARAYLIDQLRLYGFDVRVQDTDAVRAEQGTTARIANIIAIKPGTKRDAIGLIAHYDSRPQAPGAGDDGLGVAVCLEAARVLGAQAGRAHSLMIILTDGEELGMMGASAAVKDPDVVARLRAFLNVESIGSGGQSLLFETGPRSLPLLDAWANAAPHPRGTSYAIEVYKRLPNDTDFTIFREQNIPGLNFAAFQDSYAYHTRLDAPDRLQNATLRHTGESIVATATALDRLDLTANTAAGARDSDVRYFDVLSRGAFAYTPLAGRLLAIAAVLIGVFAWLRVLRQTASHRILRTIVSFIWGVLAIAATIGALLGAAWLLRASREVFHPWYAHPMRLLFLLVIAGVAGGWHVSRLMHLFPEGGQPLRTPVAVWTLMLPIWAALAAAVEYLAPAASYLWSVPLLVAGVLLSVTPPRLTLLVRLASLAIAITCAALWLRDGVDLYAFIICLLGRLPVVTPVWLYPVFVAVIGVMVAPPLVAALSGAIRGPVLHGIISAILLLVLAFAIGFAYVADAYTPDRPQQRVARYVRDVPQGKAWWEVGGNEPGLDLNLPPADVPRWRPHQRGDTLPATAPMPALNRPFVFRSEKDAFDAPADVAATVTTNDATADLEITIAPRQESLTVVFALPPDVQPAQANLAGLRSARTNRWLATFEAVPMSGIAFRASVPAALASRLADTLVIVSSDRSPDPNQPRVASWMPETHTTWQVESDWIVKPVTLQ
jgi:Peptidase family M28